MTDYLKVYEVDRDETAPIGNGYGRGRQFIVFHVSICDLPKSADPYDIEDDAVEAVYSETGLDGDAETGWHDDRTVEVILYER